MTTNPKHDKASKQQCDECGRFVAKIWRVYKTHRYCATCYARVFKHRNCPKCGNRARLPKNDADALCRRCEIDKPCARCGKTDYAVGKITSYGPVCNVCAPHFHAPKTCGLCGKMSIYLSRVSRLNIDIPICPKCARQGYQTCQACHRYRLLSEASDGRMLCKICLEKGDIPCPQCHNPMPAGYGQRCEQCYWKELLEKRIKIDCTSFAVPQMAWHFKVFGQWLGGKVGANKAASTIHRYLPFFLEIEQQWQAIPKYGELLAHFGALKLRRSQLPMTWMVESKAIVLNTFVREEDSDKRRIKAILDRFPGKSQASEILTSYYQSLIEKLKDEKTTIRSIRLALSPAAAFLQKASEMRCMPPEQRALEAYLQTAPGQRAAISGFICYLEDKHGIKLILPKPDTLRTQRNRRKKLEREMLILMQENSNSDEFRRLWLSTALAYFHGLPKKVGKTIANEHIAALEDGNFGVTWNKKTYWIPSLKSK